jgi:hypothetical protein
MYCCSARGPERCTPLDNIASRQYQDEIRPLRLALDRWLHELGFQDAGLSIRLKASDLATNSCGMSTFDVQSLIGEIAVLRSDGYVNLPGCLDGVDVPKDQLNTVIHEVMHMILDLKPRGKAAPLRYLSSHERLA